MILDTHCHLADPRLTATRAEVIVRARARGIEKFIQGGVDPEDWDRQRELTDQYPGTIVPVFGLHPWFVSSADDRTLEGALQRLEAQLSQAQAPAAIGEIGLDHGKRFSPEQRDRQKVFFRRQLDLARRTSKPVVLHVVRAHPEALERLAEVNPGAGGIVHAFSGDWSVARRYLDLGFSISVGAALFSVRGEALAKMLAKIPRERLLIESDAPDGFNEPLAIFEIASKLAEALGRSDRDLLEQSAENARAIFFR